MPYPSCALTIRNPVAGSKLGGRKLVAPASLGATSTPSLAGSLAGLGMGRPSESIPFGPVDRRERSRQQALPGGPVQHEEIAVARSLHHHLARLAVEIGVHQHGDFVGVPVVGIVGRDLKSPYQLSRIRIQRHNAACPRIVAGPRGAIQHRRGIPRADEHKVQFADRRCRWSTSGRPWLLFGSRAGGGVL